MFAANVLTPITTNNNNNRKATSSSPPPEKEMAENPPKRRSARLTRSTSAVGEKDTGVQRVSVVKPLPFVEYRGTIKYYTDGYEIAEASDALMQWVEKQPDVDVVPLAFDMEWPFSFKTGPGKTAVIQICAEEQCCYVFHLTNLNKLPAALVVLLKHSKVRLHGVNIKNDFRKLARDFPEVKADELIANCVDLGVWCNEVCATGGRWSLERLAQYVVKRSIDKNKKVRMSRWHVIPLDENQLMYAAIDVYIGQVIYRELERRSKIKEHNEAEFGVESNGEQSLKSLKALKALKALDDTFLNK